MSNMSVRHFAKANTARTDQVKLRGTFLEGSKPDLPTLIWLPELTEPAANFQPFFDTPRNKIRQLRNVWLLDYRNQGESDHHQSYEMEDMTNDIVRFMDENKLTMATIGGHGFGAKVAAATAINHMDRFTGLIQYEGGPLNHKYYEAYQELESYVKFASKLQLDSHDAASATKAIETGIGCKKWASIFKQNLNTEGSSLSWEFNIDALAKNMSKQNPDVATWSQSYGLWPGQTFAIFAAYSRWVHLSTNTLPFYNVMPRLQNTFPEHITTWAPSVESQDWKTHWMHEVPEADPELLRSRMARWIRNHDGVNVLLADRTEVGNWYVPDRGTCDNGSRAGEYIPEHVHHNYKHTNAYVESR